MLQIRGDHLSIKLQNECLRRFVHRFTKEHTPAWAKDEWKDGKPYPVQFASDKEWLDNTYFWITKKGELSTKHKYYESNPTWPNNPELRK